MRFRRLTALFSGLCALSLILGPGRVSCKNTIATDSDMPSAAAGDHSGRNQHDGAKQTQHKPCESSTVVCCNAMTSCGLSASLGERMSRGERGRRDAGALPPLVQVALNLVIPPDPPPPKG